MSDIYTIDSPFPLHVTQKIDRIAQLEKELAAMTDLAILKDRAIDLNLKELADARKDQERYRFVRDMTPEQFENTSTIHEDFDRQIDAMIKEQQ